MSANWDRYRSRCPDSGGVGAHDGTRKLSGDATGRPLQRIVGRPSGGLPHLRAHETSDRQQRPAANAASYTGYDGADVEPARGRTGTASAEHSEKLAAEYADDGVANRPKIELLENCSSDIAAGRAVIN